MADLEAEDFENPNPSIHDLFAYYNQIYFEGKLGPCTLQWSSKRMTLCAGLCQYSALGGCEIRLSEPLLKYRPVSDLKNTLLHEMIHAYLFLTNGNKDHDDHGPRFQYLMMMINNFTLMDEERPEDGYAVTIYHDFKDEVDLYRTHHWRCDKCSDLIKRAMNRTPSVSDCLERLDACSHPRCHWHMHQKKCGGNFEKIREPDGYVDKRKKAGASAESRLLNAQSGDGDDAQATTNGQKRKVSSSNGGPSKKGAKEPPVQVKTARVDSFFSSVQKDNEAKTAHTQTPAIEKDHRTEKPSKGKNLYPGEVNGKRKLSFLNDLSRKESGSDTTEGSREFSFTNQPSDVKKQGKGIRFPHVTSTQMDEKRVTIADEDLGKTRGSKRPSAPPTQGKENLRSKDFRQNGPTNDASGICGDSPSKRKYKTVGELLKKQTGKEPVVILAWANWVSYESDEEHEEPLLNRRTERRKRIGTSELLSKKGKAVLDPPNEEDTATFAAPEDRSAEQKGQNGDPVVLIDDDGHKDDDDGVPDRAVTENTEIFIELSDDEMALEEATGTTSNGGKGRPIEGSYGDGRPLDGRDGNGRKPDGRYGFPEHALLKKDTEKKPNPCQIPLTRAARRGRSEALEGKDVSSLGERVNGREESSTQKDVMICPICKFVFRENERNTFVNKHIDECLTRCP